MMEESVRSLLTLPKPDGCVRRRKKPQSPDSRRSMSTPSLSENSDVFDPDFGRQLDSDDNTELLALSPSSYHNDDSLPSSVVTPFLCFATVDNDDASPALPPSGELSSIFEGALLDNTSSELFDVPHH